MSEKQTEGELKKLLLPIAERAHDEDVCSNEEADQRANQDIDNVLNKAKAEFLKAFPELADPDFMNAAHQLDDEEKGNITAYFKALLLIEKWFGAP